MTSEASPSYIRTDQEPIGLTKDIFPSAVRKVSVFCNAIFPSGVPSSVQERLRDVLDNPTQGVSIDESYESHLLSQDDPRMRGLAAYFDIDDGNLHFPKHSRESTAVHEVYHYLSADMSTKTIGFFDGETIWQYYFNEAFTDLLTNYTVLQKPYDVFHVSRLHDESLRLRNKYLENGYDRQDQASKSYKKAYDNLLHILTDVGNESIPQVMRQLTDSYFSQNIDNALQALFPFTHRDYSQFDERSGPPEDIPLFHHLLQSYDALATDEIDIWRKNLKDLRLKTGLIPNRDTSAENDVLQGMTDVITLRKQSPKITVRIRFPEFTPDGNGISVVHEDNENPSSILVNTQLLDMSKYIPYDACFRDAFRMMMIECADQLEKIHILFTEPTITKAKRSHHTRVSEAQKSNPSYQNAVREIYQMMIADPGNPSYRDEIRRLLGIDSVLENMIDGGQEMLSSIHNTHKNSRRDEIDRKEMKHNQKETDRLLRRI